LLVYALLLFVHLAKFGTIAYGVPNIAGWAGRYPGYGWTWELTAINLPAELVHRVPWLRHRLVVPQAVSGHGFLHRKIPKAWSPARWLIAGALGYAIAGLAVGCLVAIVRARTRATRPRENPPRPA
jgi:hypothetical protein